MRFRFAVLAPLLVGATAPEARPALAAAVEAYHGGDLSTARAMLRTTVKIDPRAPVPRALQARVFLAGGDGAGATAAIDEAIANGFRPSALAHLRAHALLLQGRAKEAMATAGAVRGPVAARAYASRIAGNAALMLGKPDEAAHNFDRAIALSPRSSLLWTDIARLRLAIGNAGGAIEAADRATVYGPGNADAALLSAQLARGQYGPRAATPLFERALALRPDDVTAMTEMAATLAEAGQARAALAMTRELLSIDRANPRAFFIQSVIAARAGHFALARALIYRTGGRIDAVPAVQLLRGALEIDAGSNEQAIARLTDLLDARPLHFPARRLLALARWRAGDAAGTVMTLAPLARRADADPWTLALTGRALQAQQKREEGAAFLKRAAAARPGAAESFDLAAWPGADPSSADVVIPRISQLAARGQGREAVAMAMAVRARSPGSPGAWLALGDALTISGDFAGAAETYRQAANIDFSEPVALRLIAALNRAGSRVEAASAASLYLKQNPRSISALVMAANAAMAERQWVRAAALFGNLQLRLGSGNISAAAGLRAARQRSDDGSRG